MEREDVERLVGLESSIARLEAKVDILLGVQKEQLDDMGIELKAAGERINKLERWRYGIGGSIVVALISLFKDQLPFV